MGEVGLEPTSLSAAFYENAVFNQFHHSPVCGLLPQNPRLVVSDYQDVLFPLISGIFIIESILR